MRINHGRCPCLLSAQWYQRFVDIRRTVVPRYTRSVCLCLKGGPTVVTFPNVEWLSIG